MAVEDGPELTPRATAAVAAPPSRRPRAWAAIAVLVFVLAGAGFLVFQALTNATWYFCNADEVGRRSECDGDGRFRLQGTVVDGSLVNDGGTLHFAVTYNGATVPVTYQGQPGGIFQEGIPVVVEGRLRGDTFAGDRILVKHTEQYVEDNPGRVPEGAP